METMLDKYMPFRYADVRLNGWVVTISLICVLLSGCGEPTAPFPKPSGWPRIDLPSHTYQLIRDENCPFSFEAPAFGQVESRKPDSCWMDLYFEKFQCRWHITYRYLPGSGRDIAEHNEEYRKLVFKHIQKVNQIKETPLKGDNGNGIMYELFGTVGVPAQVFYTDSTHMVMAAFYFDEAVRHDSLAPVIDFLKEDLAHMMYSIEWK